MAHLAAHDLEHLRRSATMVAAGQSLPVDRDIVLSMLDEVTELRALVTRLGADITTAAKIARSRG
jgi:hypothetical protein